MRRGSVMGGLIAAGTLAVGLFLGEHPCRSSRDTNQSILGAPAPSRGPAPASGPESAPPVSPEQQMAAPDPTPDKGEISVLSLVHEMSRLDHLARLPAAAFRTKQQSSTDRRSQSPQAPDTWFANDDFVTDTKPNLVRVDTNTDGTKRYVLLDTEGPGAVVRIWTATPTGTLRIYVDDNSRPALEADMGKLLAGRVPPFVAPFGQVTAMGYSLYFPFPYQRRCVVTVDTIVSIDPFSGKPIDKLYYQIGTRTYGPASRPKVRSYAAAELARARGTILRVATELRDGVPETPPPGRATFDIAGTVVGRDHSIVATLRAPNGAGQGRTKKETKTIKDGGQRDTQAGAQITRLRLVTDERDPAKLRSTFLSIVFDDELTVRAPLVDFFGTGPAWNPYSSLPMTIGADGSLICRFVMPFQRKAVVSISRDAPGAVVIRGQIDVDPQPFGSDTLLFHARWRPTEVVRTRPFRDWHLATLGGRGHLVGTVLDVENPPGAAWWGEGDEKIYVDGEIFPGIFGTGTEDYFGYAWSSNELFMHAYHAQTRATGPGFSGQFSMNRFHILDPIPFDHSLRFDLEAWHWTDTAMTMDATIYWYARPHGTDDFPADRP